MKHLELMAINDQPAPINQFLKHITQLINIKCIGPTTLAVLRERMLGYFGTDQVGIDATNDFCDFQITTQEDVDAGTAVMVVDEDSVIVNLGAAEDDVVFLQFNLFEEKK